MRGANDINLRVTMDAQQARAEAKRLHSELERKFRKPTLEESVRRAWEGISGMPTNPNNPNLPYEQARHSGIWWANQRGIKGLGNEQYRHQFFTEREAKYMGIQFARAARKELISGVKGFTVGMGMFALNEYMGVRFNRAIMPGQNNREAELNRSTWSGAQSGAATGSGLMTALSFLLNFAGPYGKLIKVGLPIVGGLVGGLIGGWGGRENEAVSHRNATLSKRLSYETEHNMRTWNRRLQFSDMALQKQLQLMPSRAGQIALLDRQMNQLQFGKGSLSIRNLWNLRKAMTEGGVWGGKRYKEGDIDTQKGQWVQSLLSGQYGRLEQLRAQKQMLQFRPHAGVQDAVTDSYSQRGLFVGAQVDSVSVNREIVADMRKIIKLLEEVRTRTGEGYRLQRFERGSQVQYDS